MSRTPLVLGVDGGGTKSIGLISDYSGKILAHQQVGATNPNVVGVDVSARRLFELVSKCCEEARCEVNEIHASVLGLAGAGGADSQEKMMEALNAQFLNTGAKSPPLIIETDARIALEGALDGAPGVIVISGTGSIVMGKTQQGEIHAVGGWGRILGDEGSGFAIGRDGVRAVTHFMDRRGESTKLKDLLSAKFQWLSREDIIKAVYQKGFDPSKVAPLVMEAAVNHDLVCQKILQNSAAQLVDQIRVVVMRMGVLRKVSLVMCGGLLEGSTVFSNVLQLKIMKSLPQVEIRKAAQSPAHGAVRMAIDRVRRM